MAKLFVSLVPDFFEDLESLFKLTTKPQRRIQMFLEDMKFTVLKRESGNWGKDREKILSQLLTQAREHPQHPQVLILQGTFEKEEIANVLGNDKFDLEVFVGAHNPRLPF
jgi:hypothetical protein